MTTAHLLRAPESRVVRTDEVEVERLDDLGVLQPEERAYLKLDVQGMELDVLRGSTQTLSKTHVVEAELSAVELYQGQALIGEVIEHLRGVGFLLIGLETSFRDRATGDLLQVNGFFRRGTS